MKLTQVSSCWDLRAKEKNVIHQRREEVSTKPGLASSLFLFNFKIIYWTIFFLFSHLQQSSKLVSVNFVGHRFGLVFSYIHSRMYIRRLSRRLYIEFIRQTTFDFNEALQIECAASSTLGKKLFGFAKRKKLSRLLINPTNESNFSKPLRDEHWYLYGSRNNRLRLRTSSCITLYRHDHLNIFWRNLRYLIVFSGSGFVSFAKICRVFLIFFEQYLLSGSRRFTTNWPGN